MRIQINKDTIVEGVDINHNKIIECDIPDTVIVDLFDRYQDLKNEYDNWLESEEANRLRQRMNHCRNR